MCRPFVSLLFVLFLARFSNGDNRSDAFDLAVSKLGVTFYTSAELQVIAKCTEPQIYETPNNNTAIREAFRSCIMNNSGNKAVKALSLYNNANNCLDPESLETVCNRLTPPFQKLAAPMVKKMKASLADCKKNNKATGTAKQDACMQQLYGLAKAAVTLNYVDTLCKKLVNQNVTKQEWDCTLKLAPSVMTTSKYTCSNIVKS